MKCPVCDNLLKKCVVLRTGEQAYACENPSCTFIAYDHENASFFYGGTASIFIEHDTTQNKKAPAKCQYCGSNIIADKRGNCSSCGAPV